MTPVSLNRPPPANSSYPLIGDQIHDQPQLFISPNNRPSSSTLSYHTFFDQEGFEAVFHAASSNYQAYSTSDQAAVMDELLMSNRTKDKEISKSSHGYAESSKWMPSKMRLMRKMMTTPDAAENSQRISPSNTTRVCSDCNTTSTPLWRSGPKGPKSLCNACGIRKRKARRAMAEAAAAANGSVDIGSSNSTIRITKTRAHNKLEKKHGTNHFGQFKSKGKSTTSRLERKPSFSNDEEVTAAAQLLMELSCAFLHI
ncbi:hypothetical protein L6164_024504 [Bauhinia variegata]|uniref:Uncharacterized protein n=1 Tax=Bauhinia variegata TaxID=167791 RepID=A0ACB9LXQ7_BAUVA|nr:hypothetical protein L6164_024504 [Bauhinia variegata]